ncbi:MAG TPA: dihydroneopterin aldolase [Burkholderiales bacterium]|nr:dihydroneopterin aldolase [Betaproteobacteria bacterium]HQR51782.1 dihydroneopterin aldolase [Burkholderiales bacterium]
MDIIFIEDFRVETLIGIYEWERRVPQTIQIDIEIGNPGSRAAATDDIVDTIDYGAVVSRIEETLKAQQFLLLERLAEHIADIIRGEFRSPWVKVSVAKLQLLRGVKRLGVTIERGSRT